MSAADILSHPLFVTLLAFVLAQGVALGAVFWRISTAVRVGGEMNKHLADLIEQNTGRIKRLEGWYFNDQGKRR